MSKHTKTPHGERFTAAVAAETAAYNVAQTGDQLGRIAHFRALSELVAADDACRAASAEKAAAADGAAPSEEKKPAKKPAK